MPQHHLQRLWIDQSVIAPHLDQRRRRQPAVSNEFLTVGKWHNVVGLAVQDHGAGFHRPNCAVLLPGWAEQTSFASPLSIFIAATRSHYDLRLLLVVFGLGDADGRIKIFMRQRRVDDLLCVILQVRRFHAARHRLPTVEEEDFHRRSFYRRGQCFTVLASDPAQAGDRSVGASPHKQHLPPNRRNGL